MCPSQQVVLMFVTTSSPGYFWIIGIISVTIFIITLIIVTMWLCVILIIGTIFNMKIYIYISIYIYMDYTVYTGYLFSWDIFTTCQVGCTPDMFISEKLQVENKVSRV